MKLYAGLSIGLSLMTACGGDDGGKLSGAERGSLVPDGGVDASDPRYAIMREVYNGTDSDSYLNVFGSLDLAPLDSSQAAEFAGGRASMSAFDGHVFVSPPNTRSIFRYDVGPDGKLTQSGQIGLDNYGFDVSVDEWSVSYISPTKAYVFSPVDGTVVVWNPTLMEVTGEITPPDLLRPGKSLNASSAVVSGNRLVRVVYWNADDTYIASDEQYLAVYDIEQDKFVELIEERRCPAMNNRVSKDPAGNMYFSNWVWQTGDTLVHGAPPGCALRIKAGEARFDPDWVLRFPELTEGRQGAMFNVLSDGSALLSAFYHERATIDATTESAVLAGSNNWRVWRVDLGARTAAPLEGIDWMAGATSVFDFDGRRFVFVPSDEWSRVKVYEIVDGRGVFRIEIEGWAYQFVKIR